MYDFSKVAPAAASNFMEPGIYKAKIKEAKEVTSKTKGTPGLSVTFVNKENQTVTEVFYLTDESQNRLQYLHTAWLGSELTGKFKTAAEVIAYFIKKLGAATKTVKTLLVGGKIGDNGLVYSSLPYSGFVIEDDNVELGEFDTDSAEYKKWVKPNNMKSEVSGKKNGILNDEEDEAPIDDNDEWATEEPEEAEEEEEKPKAKAKTAAKKPAAKDTAKKPAGKKPAKKEEEEEEEAPEEEEDPEW